MPAMSPCRQVIFCAGINVGRFDTHPRLLQFCMCADGGGMKGMAAVQLLRELERHSGKRIHELFDLIGEQQQGSVISPVAVPDGKLRA